MKITELNIKHENFFCPVSGMRLQDETMGYADEVPSVVGYWIGIVIEEPTIKNAELEAAWEGFRKNHNRGSDFIRFLSEYENSDWVVFQLTTGAWRSVDSTIWYVIDMSWEETD